MTRIRLPIALCFVLVASVTVFATLAVQVSLGRSILLDRVSLDVLGHGADRPIALHVLHVLGTAGSAWGTIAISAIVLTILLVTRRRDAALFFAASVAIAALSPALKDLFERPSRATPWKPAATGYFPSGHATGSMAVTAAIVALAWNTRMRVPVGAAAAIAAAVVGLSAVYNGGHWPTDVLGGWALSLAWVAAVCIAASVWQSERCVQGARE